MLRSVLSTVALAAVLATAHPAFADPLETMASDQSQAAAAAAQQATPVPASSAGAVIIVPASTKDFSPVGSGWG